MFSLDFLRGTLPPMVPLEHIHHGATRAAVPGADLLATYRLALQEEGVLRLKKGFKALKNPHETT